MKVALTKVDLAKWLAYGPAQMTAIWGWNANNSVVYIQFHEVPGTIPTGAIPIGKSLLASANNGFFYALNGQEYTELNIGFSTAEDTYQPVAASSGLDATVEFESVYNVTTEVVTGDLTTGVDGRTIFADAAASSVKKLRRIDYKNNDGVTRYLSLSIDNGVTTSKVWPVAAGVTLNLFAGKNDVLFSGANGVLHYGCLVFQSSVPTPPTITSSAVSLIRTVHLP